MTQQSLATLLTESHRDLRRCLLFHQECLLLKQDDFAAQMFTVLSDYLKQHLQFEDTVLFADIAACAITSQWPLNVYQKEHEKIGTMLVKNQHMLNQYLAMQGREKRFALLELLDTQNSFLHVLEHHEEREEKDIFLQLGQLDEQMLIPQWQAINQQLLQQHDKLLLQVEEFLWKTH